MKNVVRGKRCDLNLAPTLSSSAKERALSSYSLLFMKGHEKDKIEAKSKLSSCFTDDTLEEEDSADFIDDVLSCIECLDTTASTSELNKIVFNIFHPVNFCRYSEEILSLALKRRLLSSVRSIPWNKDCVTYRQTVAHSVEELANDSDTLRHGLDQTAIHNNSNPQQEERLDPWDVDFRFLGPWWVSLRLPVLPFLPRRSKDQGSGEHLAACFTSGVQEGEIGCLDNIKSGKLSRYFTPIPTSKRSSASISATEGAQSISSMLSSNGATQVLRDPETTGRKKSQSSMLIPTERYPPHLLPEEIKDESKVNEYIARLAMRFRTGPLFCCESLHFDHIDMTPSRMHVFMFEGVVARVQHEYQSRVKLNFSSLDMANMECSWVSPKERKFLSRTAHLSPLTESLKESFSSFEKDDLKGLSSMVFPLWEENLINENSCRLETISFSICNIGNSALMVLFTGLMAMHVVPPSMENLDLSYNSLTYSCLYLLAGLLPCTRVRRLSLRGNNLFSKESQSFREFLLRGCYFLEELDLSYTNLSHSQLHELAELLRHRRRLCSLLLYGMKIPQHFLAGVEELLRKDGKFLLLCDQWKNGPQDEKGTSVCTSGLFCSQKSFFSDFYKNATQHGWRPPDLNALPRGYRPFRFNDPSLPDNLYA